MRIRLLLLLSLILACYACRRSPDTQTYTFTEAGVKHQLSLIHYRDSFYRLTSSIAKAGGSLEQVSSWRLPYPVFKFITGDVDNDGHTDILIGLSKRTRFDPYIRKRLFTFTLTDGTIRPLWLSSRLGQPLEDFGLVRQGDTNFVQSIELEQNGSYLLAQYKWKSFGLKFDRYLLRNSSLEQIRHIKTWQ